MKRRHSNVLRKATWNQRRAWWARTGERPAPPRLFWVSLGFLSLGLALGAALSTT